MLSVGAAATLDFISGVSLLTISQTRLHHVAKNSQANTWLFLVLSIAFSSFVALLPILSFVARPFYYRHRIPLVLLVRIGAIIAAVWPHVVPDAVPDSCGSSTLWGWLLNSHGVTSGFLSLGFPLPLGTHVWAALAQQAALLVTAWDRCVTPIGGSFLDLYPPRCFMSLATVLDWPFYMVAPGTWATSSTISHKAACLACTLWAQILVGGVVPTVLLLKHTTTDSELRHGIGRLLSGFLGKHPWLMVLFIAQLLWLPLRSACDAYLPLQIPG